MTKQPKIILISKGFIEGLPPLLTLAEGLRKLGREVDILCSAVYSTDTRKKLKELGIRVVELYRGDAYSSSPVKKLLHYAAFHRNAWDYLDRQPQNTILWIARPDPLIALGPKLKRRKFIMALYELHDRHYHFMLANKFFAHSAYRIVVPEENRGEILRVWLKLKETPFVFPNKPLGLQRGRDLPVSDENARKVVESLPKDKRVALYLGRIDEDRNIEPFAKAVQRLKDRYVFLIVGKNRKGIIEKLRGMCDNIYHIEYITPPYHLEVASHCHVGVAGYDYIDLNNIYCAPNKIWEYSAFGIPLICQNIPGLRYTVGAAGAGECVELRREEEIVEGLRKIDEDYEAYSQRATEFFDSVDVMKLIEESVR